MFSVFREIVPVFLLFILFRDSRLFYSILSASQFSQNPKFWVLIFQIWAQRFQCVQHHSPNLIGIFNLKCFQVICNEVYLYYLSKFMRTVFVLKNIADSLFILFYQLIMYFSRCAVKIYSKSYSKLCTNSKAQLIKMIRDYLPDKSFLFLMVPD